MKFSLLTLAILCSFSTFAQYVKPNNTYGIIQNRSKADIVQHIPEKNAHEVNTIDSSTQLYYYRPDSSIWAYNKIKGHWKIGSASGGSNSGGGSSSTFDFYARTGTFSDTLFKVIDGVETPAYIIDRFNPFVQPGSITWSNFGYTYNITAGIWSIGSSRVTTPADSFTLDTPHATLHRIDLIYANAAGQILVRKGTPAPSPVAPDFDPATEYKVSAITVYPNTTSPIGQLSLALVYDEKNPGEWTVSSNLVTVNDASTTTPFRGTKTVSVGTTVNGSYIDFTAPSAIDASLRNTFSFQMRLLSALNGNRRITVTLYNGTIPVSNIIILDAKYGLNSANTSGYQNIVIPLTAFGLTQNAISKVRFTFSGGSSGVLLDYVKFEGGIPQPVTDPYVLPIATLSNIGGVKPDGTSVTIDPDGTIHAVAPIIQDLSPYRLKSDTTAITGTATIYQLQRLRDSIGAALITEINARIAADDLKVNKTDSIQINNIVQSYFPKPVFNVSGGGGGTSNDSAFVRVEQVTTKTFALISAVHKDTVALITDTIPHASLTTHGTIRIGTGWTGYDSATGILNAPVGTAIDTTSLSNRINNTYNNFFGLADSTGVRFTTPNGRSDTLRILGNAAIDTANKWVNNISRKPGVDSIYWRIGGVTYAIKDSTGGGGGGAAHGADYNVQFALSGAFSSSNNFKYNPNVFGSATGTTPKQAYAMYVNPALAPYKNTDTISAVLIDPTITLPAGTYYSFGLNSRNHNIVANGIEFGTGTNGADKSNTVIGNQVWKGTLAGGGTANTFMGFLAGLGNPANGSYNTGIGNGAMYQSGGDANTVVGVGTMQSAGTGRNNNTLMGFQAGISLTGNDNIAIGRDAGRAMGSSNIMLGYRAGQFEAGSNKLYIGSGPLLSGVPTQPMIYGDNSLGQVAINGTGPAASGIQVSINAANSFEVNNNGTSKRGAVPRPRVSQAERDLIPMQTGVITKIVISAPGTGVTSPLTVTIGGVGSGATATHGNSPVQYVTITNGGTGYANGTTTVTFSGGSPAPSVYPTGYAIVGNSGTEVYCVDCAATDGSIGVNQTWNGTAWKNQW